ncbi:MAG TPA: pyridoxamine 5'-phosphate oxidase family protein [Acidimicrobiia bacterium]|nr:pyridoxamine 5'-phosphate oxidase family protein [Acidimicrobiia bacterium]
MSAPVTTELVWRVVDKHVFAVLALVTPAGEARSAGIVYVVDHHNFYISTGRETWKSRHIMANPNVSLTVTIPKRLPFVPFLKIPSAVATCQGTAEILDVGEVDPSIVQRIYRGMEVTEQIRRDTCVIKVTPTGDFVTYGIGVPMIRMRNPEEAQGRAPVR